MRELSILGLLSLLAPLPVSSIIFPSNNIPYASGQVKTFIRHFFHIMGLKWTANINDGAFSRFPIVLNDMNKVYESDCIPLDALTAQQKDLFTLLLMEDYTIMHKHNVHIPITSLEMCVFSREVDDTLDFIVYDVHNDAHIIPHVHLKPIDRDIILHTSNIHLLSELHSLFHPNSTASPLSSPFWQTEEETSFDDKPLFPSLASLPISRLHESQTAQNIAYKLCQSVSYHCPPSRLEKIQMHITEQEELSRQRGIDEPLSAKFSKDEFNGFFGGFFRRWSISSIFVPTEMNGPRNLMNISKSKKIFPSHREIFPLSMIRSAYCTEEITQKSIYSRLHFIICNGSAAEIQEIYSSDKRFFHIITWLFHLREISILPETEETIQGYHHQLISDLIAFAIDGVNKDPEPLRWEKEWHENYARLLFNLVYYLSHIASPKALSPLTPLVYTERVRALQTLAHIADSRTEECITWNIQKEGLYSLVYNILSRNASLWDLLSKDIINTRFDMSVLRLNRRPSLLRGFSREDQSLIDFLSQYFQKEETIGVKITLGRIEKLYENYVNIMRKKEEEKMEINQLKENETEGISLEKQQPSNLRLKAETQKMNIDRQLLKKYVDLFAEREDMIWNIDITLSELLLLYSIMQKDGIFRLETQVSLYYDHLCDRLEPKRGVVNSLEKLLSQSHYYKEIHESYRLLLSEEEYQESFKLAEEFTEDVSMYNQENESESPLYKEESSELDDMPTQANQKINYKVKNEKLLPIPRVSKEERISRIVEGSKKSCSNLSVARAAQPLTVLDSYYAFWLNILSVFNLDMRFFEDVKKEYHSDTHLEVVPEIIQTKLDFYRSVKYFLLKNLVETINIISLTDSAVLTIRDRKKYMLEDASQDSLDEQYAPFGFEVDSPDISESELKKYLENHNYATAPLFLLFDAYATMKNISLKDE